MWEGDMLVHDVGLKGSGEWSCVGVGIRVGVGDDRCMQFGAAWTKGT